MSYDSVFITITRKQTFNYIKYTFYSGFSDTHMFYFPFNEFRFCGKHGIIYDH